MKLAALLVAVLIARCLNAAVDKTQVCPSVMMTLIRSADQISEPGLGNKVDIRICDGGGLQIAAWGKAKAAPLLVEAGGSSIFSVATAADTVFVIATAGATGTFVQVVTFEKGLPRLALDQAVRAYPEIKVGWKEVQIRMNPADPNTRVFKFATQID